MKNDDDLCCDNEVCSDHFVCGKPCELYETTKQDWVPSLSLGHSGRKLTGKIYKYNRASARAFKRRKVYELLARYRAGHER